MSIMRLVSYLKNLHLQRGIISDSVKHIIFNERRGIVYIMIITIVTKKYLEIREHAG